MLNNLGKKYCQTLLFIWLKMFILPKLATVLDKFERKIRGQGDLRARKGFTFFISIEDMDFIIKIVQSLEKSGLLIDGAIETLKREIIKTKKVDFLGL